MKDFKLQLKDQFKLPAKIMPPIQCLFQPIRGCHGCSCIQSEPSKVPTTYLVPFYIIEFSLRIRFKLRFSISIFTFTFRFRFTLRFRFRVSGFSDFSGISSLTDGPGASLATISNYDSKSDSNSEPMAELLI